MTTAPCSISLFRGQSRSGIGEGPGQPILHGEQYLAADPPLGDSGELLAAVRPWLTLDSDPSDRRALGERLEAWSCFAQGGYLFIARLSAAGTYDRRAAYFTHARAWEIASLPAGFDPGIHLGCGQAFEAPWRDGERGAPQPEPAPPHPEMGPVAAERTLAERMLAYLYTACETGVPLVLAVPAAELMTQGAIPHLISFARAALPADLKLKCRLRIYTRLPDLFLRHLGAHLVVVPEEIAADALAARLDATLLDREGNLRSGRPCEPGALAYAREVLPRALALPEGLSRFSERFARQRLGRGLPSEREVKAVPVIYNLAYALESPGERMGDLLQRYLLPIAGKLSLQQGEWDRLIAAEDWLKTPRKALSALLLRPPTDLELGARALQEAAEAAVGGIEFLVEVAVEEQVETPQLSRLLDLYSRPRPLARAEDVAACSRGLELEEIAATGRAATVLRAELEAGQLEEREWHQEVQELAALARDGQCLRVLVRATSEGALSAAWAETFVASAPRERLIPAARELLTVVGQRRWASVVGRLLDRLRGLERPPLELLGGLGEALRQPAVQGDLKVYLRLTDLLAHLALAGGSLPLQQAGAAAPRLATRQLLRLGEALDEEPPGVRKLFLRELDRRLRGCRSETVEAMVATGWWFPWRQATEVGPQDLWDVAWEWLRCPAWRAHGTPEATLECWQQVIEDLQTAGMSGDRMHLLCREDGAMRPRWPWIPVFEEGQLRDLAELAADGGALAELAALDQLAGSRVVPLEKASIRRVVEDVLRRQFDLGFESLDWLLGRGSAATAGAVLPLETSARLLDRAGHLRERALQARMTSVLGHLEREPFQAVRHADASQLWSQAQFCAELRRWLLARWSRGEIGNELLGLLDRRVVSGAGPVPEVGAKAEGFTRELVRRGLERLAEFVDPRLREVLHQNQFARRLLQALKRGRAEDGCWQELRQAVARYKDNGSAGQHPVSRLAAVILGTDSPPPEESWDTFLEVAGRLPTLLEADGVAARLPALELAAAVLDRNPLGTLAVRFATLRQAEIFSDHPDWWKALVAGLRLCRRRSETRGSDDDELTARALLAQMLNRLPARRRRHLAQALWPDTGAGLDRTAAPRRFTA